MTAKKQDKSPSTKRAALLQAARDVVLDRGVEALTLDAVSQQAGVSKGGLLYHFPGKDALIAGMVKQFVEDFDAALKAKFAQDSADESPGQWLRAYIRTTQELSRRTLALIARLTSISAESPELFAAAEIYAEQWQEHIINSGIDPIKATIILLAADGLWLSEAFQVGNLREPELTQVINALIEMTRQP